MNQVSRNATQTSEAIDAILIGLPGPTHHYGGLAPGNVASQQHTGQTAQPRAAGLQCLALAERLYALGLPVAILPPLLRPDLAALRAAGFDGEPGAMVAEAAAAEPDLVNAAYASAAMWVANAGTVIPATDSADGRCHLIPANLLATAHRALECEPRAAMLRAFLQPAGVVVDEPLPATLLYADEGAANHTRLAGGVHIFVYGRDGAVLGQPSQSPTQPQRFAPRQSRLAQAAIARRCGLDPQRCVYVQQNPIAIDAGAFHNDVVMVGHGDRVLIHQQAWSNQAQTLTELQRLVPGLRVAEIPTQQLSLDESVACYLFNSQLVQLEDRWLLIAPEECRGERPAAVIAGLLADGFVDEVLYHDLRQSMQGGGGPACLRLRLPLTPAAWSNVDALQGATGQRCSLLRDWLQRHYRERLGAGDLADPELARESIAAQRDLAQVLTVSLTSLVPPNW